MSNHDPMIKLCPKCNQKLPVWMFTSNSRRKDGLQANCRNCMKLYRRQHYQANKAQYIERTQRTQEELKTVLNTAKFRPCMDCGNSYPLPVMEFDHVRGDKVANVSRVLKDGSLPKLREEIAKCDVVCANCHRMRTATRAGWNMHEPTGRQSVSKTDLN